MWRAFFLAIGVCFIIVGIEGLGVERVILRITEDPAPPNTLLSLVPQTPELKQLIPAPWIPWSFLSSGVVVCLYSFTIPKRVQGKQ
ncbi:MAG: hypothetical protein ABSG68_10185 [Thermoguttaceae bacterium]|jgi:hypothetical protein